jgi:hypothetical protein
VGGASVVSPMYIAEISPARLRGRLVAVTQFNIVLGILLAFFSNYLIAGRGLGEVEWRWMFGVEAFPAAAFFLLLFLTPQSPRWLVARGREDEARAVLARLGSDPAEAEAEVRSIRDSLDLEHHRLAEPLFRRAYRGPVLLAVAIAAFNQLSGINAILYYAPAVFRMAGSGQDAALLQSVIVGGTNLVFTLLAMAVIDRFGRRRLMLVGSVGYVLSLSAVAWAFYRYGAAFDEAGGRIVLAEPARLHRLPRVRAGSGHLGLHQRGLPEPGARPGPGPRQLHPLVHGRRHLVDLPGDRRGLGRPRLRVLRGDDGPAAPVGPAGHAGDEGRPPRGDPAAARDRLKSAFSASTTRKTPRPMPRGTSQWRGASAAEPNHSCMSGA